MADQPLSDLDRRTIANLAIPRNVEDLTHELRTDPYTATRPEGTVGEHLRDLEANGWVVRVPASPDPAHVAANLPKHARQMEDEQANIYARRLAHPSRSWRTTGDLWVITHDGIDKLKEPVVAIDPFTTSELADLIRSQHSAIHWGPPPGPDDDVSLQASDVMWRNPRSGISLPLPRLLEDEYTQWLTAVLADHRGRWGEGADEQLRKQLPLAGGAGWSDVYENRILDHENQKTAMPALVAPWFMALSILAFTDTDTPTTANDGTHVPTYTGYARKSVAAADMATASAGSSANGNAITFAACTSGSSSILGFANCEASGTTGDLRKYGTCSSTTVSITQTPATFAVGAYTTTAD